MTKPCYDHAGIRIFLGDCREILPTLEPVDAMITDPPYGISHKSSHGASWEGTEIQGDGCTTIRDWAWNQCKEKPRAAFGISWKQRPPPDVRMTLIWNKGAAFGAGDLTIPWKPSWEEIYIGGKGWLGRRDEGVLCGPCEPSWESGPAHDGNGRKHPHQKPVWIMSRLIEKLPDAQTIIDPFCGSGTTLIAAKLLGKIAIGIEIEEKYAEIAARRLQQEVFDFGSRDRIAAEGLPERQEYGLDGEPTI